MITGMRDGDLEIILPQNQRITVQTIYYIEKAHGENLNEQTVKQRL